MCVKKTVVVNLKKLYPRTFIDFRLRAHQRFGAYIQSLGTHEIPSASLTLCESRLSQTYKVMQKVPKVEKMLLNTDQKTPAILLDSVVQEELTFCSASKFVRKYSKLEDRLLKNMEIATKEIGFVNLCLKLRKKRKRKIVKVTEEQKEDKGLPIFV